MPGQALARVGGAACAAALTAGLVLSSCGGDSVTAPGDRSPSTSLTTGSPPAGTVVVARTGGLAGVKETVTVQQDGSARLTTRDGAGRDCTPSAASLDRLRAIDIGAVAAAPTTGPVVADGFTYSVIVGDARASVSQGDDDSRRARLFDAAAAVLGSWRLSQ